jgi:PAS domain S-box-containing protein
MSEAADKKEIYPQLSDLEKKYSQLQSAYDALFAQYELVRQDRSAPAVKEGRKPAEIKMNNEQLRVLIDTLPDSIYIKDTAARKIVTNKVDLQLMGMPEEESIGKTDIEIFGQEIGGPRFDDDMQVLVSGKAIYNQEEHYTDSNGSSIWLLTSKVPLYDTAGKITGLLGVGRIITKRKKAEEALRASNERFHYVTKATSDAIWDWDILNDHLYWGEGYEKIFGYRIADTVANHIHSFDNIHPDDKKLVFDDIDSLLQGQGYQLGA